MTNILFDSINKKYPGSGGKFAVKDLNLEIRTGEFFCLVGPSGCGKSTTLKLIAGLEKPTSGNLIKPSNFAMVFQSGALLPWLTVFDNIAFGLKNKNLSKTKINEIVKDLIEEMGLEDFSKKYPRDLSGGQRQRVGIARALAVSPEVLLLDEPFSALDLLTTKKLHEDLLRIWKSSGLTIIMVSHLIEEAVLLSDRVGVMKDGFLDKIIEVDLSRPRSLNGKSFLEIVEKITKRLE